MNTNFFNLTSDTLTLFINDETLIFSRSDPKVTTLIDFVKVSDWEGLADYLEEEKNKVEQATDSHFTVENGFVKFENDYLPEVIGARVKEFADLGLPYTYLIRFWNRLKKNPSHRAVHCLFDYIESNNVVITDEGKMLLFKAVNSSYKDKYSNTIDNKPNEDGTPKKISIPRNAVNDDPDQQCSNGLHAGNYKYVLWYGSSAGDRYLEVLVDPENVVSVPKDHNCQKVRCCEYEILREVTKDDLPKNSSDNIKSYDTGLCDDDCDCSDDDEECPDCGWNVDTCSCYDECSDCGSSCCGGYCDDDEEEDY